MPTDELVASSGASHILRLSTTTVRTLVRRGELPVAVATPVGAMFRRGDVERVAAERDARRATAASKTNE